MDRSINDLEVLLALDTSRVNAQSMYFFEVNLVDFFTDSFDESRISFKFDVGNRHLVDFIDNALIVWCKHLSTIVPISLITIVFLRVMASCQDDTTLATQVTDSK
ncbi:hypothetical protein EVA_15306 [gut metagenome]|uniref:Uncharacterized protein n=1 Tax=gut metagenome TaxID=749906 RepID=J9FNT8_9ZZZZ